MRIELEFRVLCLGKTESTKLMVSHIIHCSGDASDRELQNRIIEVRVFLTEKFGNDRRVPRLPHCWKHSVTLKPAEIKIPVDSANIYN